MSYFKIIILSLILCSFTFPKNKFIVYLTCVEDPSHSMTVQWHTPISKNVSNINFRRKGSVEWMEASGSFKKLQNFDYLVHRVDLRDLEPNTDYEFSVQGSDQIYFFRTLPSTLVDRPVNIVIAGDAFRYDSDFKKMNKQIAAKDPDFIILGGDIAYTIVKRLPFRSKEWEVKRWMSFFYEWSENMITSHGRLVPIVPVVGNHDVPVGQVDPKNNYVLLYQLFAFKDENTSYRTLDLSDYASFFLMDTGHSYPIDGKQTQWLSDTLNAKASVPYKFAAYHISAYPSVYKYNKETPVAVRQNWSPLFERHSVQVAFEHHNHAYKRTYPIKAEKIDPTGVVYVGDGCWGASPRKPYKNAWYLEKKAKSSCFNILTLAQEKGEIVVHSDSGKEIDRLDVYENAR